MTRHDDKPASAVEAERDVADARADLEGSLDELGRKLDPEALMAQAKSYFAADGQSFGDVLVREARANPLAAIMAGAGLAWLLLGARRRTDAPRAYGATTPPEPAPPLGSTADAGIARAPGARTDEPLGAARTGGATPGAMETDPTARPIRSDPTKP